MRLQPDPKYFLPYQVKWIKDNSPLKLMEKSRQIGATHATTYRAVCLASEPGARFDVFISTRDQVQAKLTLETAKRWAHFLHLAAIDLGEIVFDRENNISAYALEFANSRRIYALSSNPNALAGKCGHVILDEFALHQDQRLLYRIAKPVTTWGGTLTILSTHRGQNTLFYELIRTITQQGNPMGWSHYRIPIHKAVREGLVERINQKAHRQESRLAFLRRLRAECIDEEQWNQEYCCIPADENSAFLTHEMITSCEDPTLHLYTIDEFLHHLHSTVLPSSICIPHSELPTPHSETSALPTPNSALLTGPSDSQPSTLNSQLYAGLDVARTTNLCVLDVGEKIGDLIYDRLRLELRNTPFPEIRAQLYRILRLPQLQRCCIDANGLGMQLAEEAQLEFGSKVEPVHITAPVKEKLAFALRADFEDRKLRLPHDDQLRADLRGIKKEVSPAGNLRFIGDADDSHCDRFWAKALRQEAARHRDEVWFLLG
ncbi:MAG TPA: terminase family protein [Tepidisphaeraceae bacterium]|nr:terminase family protein [Tepidisphaeraceae bacterium]